MTFANPTQLLRDISVELSASPAVAALAGPAIQGHLNEIQFMVSARSGSAPL